MSSGGNISVTRSGIQAPGPLYVDDTNEKRQAVIVVDNDEPTVGTPAPEAKMQVVNGRRPAPPDNDQWGPADFDIEFSLTDAGSGLDAGSIKPTAVPDVLTFSNVGETATPGVYAATVSTKDVAITADTDVVITITFKDKAGNEDSTPLTIALAKRTAGTITSTVGLIEGDTRDSVTEETEFELSGMLDSDSFAVFSAVANTDAGSTAIAGLPNLQRFFARGGTISLVGTADTKAKDVVISEIMWGLNLAAAVVNQPDKQWIEVYNTNNALSDTDDTNDDPAAIDLSKYKLVFTPGTVLPRACYAL